LCNYTLILLQAQSKDHFESDEISYPEGKYSVTDGLMSCHADPKAKHLGLTEEIFSPDAPGLVTGIVFSKDKPSAVIGCEVLCEGDITHGVTVVKIFKDKVQFEKNGRRWMQAVRQRPAGHWK